MVFRLVDDRPDEGLRAGYPAGLRSGYPAGEGFEYPAGDVSGYPAGEVSGYPEGISGSPSSIRAVAEYALPSS